MTTLNVVFANEKLKNFAMLMANILNDGGKYQSAVIFANTSQSMQNKKDGCPFSQTDVRKDCKYGISLNGVYANAVTKAQQKELNEAIAKGEVPEGTTIEKYVPKENWHKKIFDSKNGCIVAKRDEVEKGVISEIYLFVVNDYSETSQYYLKGKPATETETEQIKKWKKNRAVATAKSQGLQNAENAVVVSTISFSNITEIHANGLKVEI